MWVSELTFELAEKLLESCLTGATRRQCALANGVLPDRLEEWLVRGSSETAEDPYQTFAMLWFKQEALLVAQAEDARTRGRYRDPKMATQFLQDRFPDEYGPKARAVADPISAAMARPEKKDKVRAFIRKRDPEFFRMLLEEGALEALAEMRDQAPAKAPSEGPKSESAASEASRRPSGGTP